MRTHSVHWRLYLLDYFRTQRLFMVANWLSRIFLIIVVSVGLFTSAYAQRNPLPNTIRLQPEDLNRGQYNVQRNFYFLPPGATGENYVSAGFFGQKLRPYIQSNTQAVSELNHYRRQKIQFLADRGLLLASALVYGSQVFGHEDVTYLNNTQKVAIGGAAVALLGTIFINHHTNEYLRQAVDNYNADLPAARRGFRWQRLQPGAVGLSAAGGRPGLAFRWQL